MKNLCILCIACLPILIASSCQLKFDDTTPNPDLRLPFDNLDEYFSLQNVKSDTFAIDAMSDETLITWTGAKVLVNAGSFEKNNQPVDGNIKVVTQEMVRKSDMVLLNRPSTSGNTILEYGGTLDFRAFKNSESVDLTSTIEVTLPISNLLSTIGNFDHYKAQNDWTMVNNSPVTLDPGETVIQFDSDDHGWMCGALSASFNELTSFESSLYGFGTILTDIAGFIVLSDYNTVIKMESDIDAVRVSKSNVPKGLEANIVIIAMDNFKVFVGIKNVVLSENMSIEVKMDEIDENDLSGALEIID